MARKKKEPTLAEEAGLPGSWAPVESEPINPATKGAPSNPNKMAPFFDGSISPDMQHDATFVGTRYGTPGIPSLPLMPIGASGRPTGNAATVSIVKQLVKPATPPAGGNLVWRGTWTSFTAYSINDVVLFNISAYVAIQSNTNSEPDANPANWALLSKNLNLRGQWNGGGNGAISFAQSTGGDAGSSPVSGTFSSNNVAGNAIVVRTIAAKGFASGPFDPNYTVVVSDTQGNIYTQIGGGGFHLFTVDSSNTTTNCSVFIASNIKAGPNTVTVTVTGGGAGPTTRVDFTAAEYTTASASSPLLSFATTTSFLGPLTVSLTTDQINEIVVLTGVLDSAPAPSGFTSRIAGGDTFSYWDKTIPAALTANYTVTPGSSNGFSLWGLVLTGAGLNIYFPSDVVEYLGSTYICIKQTTLSTQNPTNTIFWTQLSQGAGSINNLIGNYSAVLGDLGKLLTNTTASNFTLTLPATPPLAAWWIAVQNSGSGTIVINPNGLTLDGSGSNLTLNQNQGILIFTNGANYFTERGFGTVTSIALVMPAEFAVSGSPVTGSGTFTVTKSNENANTVAAGPTSGSPAPWAFRTLVAADIPVVPSSFGRKVISTATYATIPSDAGKALDVQTSSATTITLNSHQLASDTFIRANENPLNPANWTTFSSSAGLQIVGNTCEPLGTGVFSAEYFSNQVWPNDQYAEVKITTLSSANAFILPSVRMGTGGTSNGYQLVVLGPTGSSNSCFIRKAIAGVLTTLITFSATPNVNDVWRLDVTGTTLTASQNGSVVATTTDSSVTSGFAGLEMFVSSGAISQAQANNWAGGSGTAAGFSGFIQNNGTAVVALTPASGLINGVASINLFPGQGCAIATDGTNFTATTWVPALVAVANRTVQIANVGATTLFAAGALAAGLYRVTVYLVVSQAATTSSTLPDSRIIFTDQDSGATITIPATNGLSGNTLSTFAQATYEINVKASTNIQYDIGQVTPYASVGGTPMQFAYRARVEFIG
jgi:hypothetical protein